MTIEKDEIALKTDLNNIETLYKHPDWEYYGKLAWIHAWQAVLLSFGIEPGFFQLIGDKSILPNKHELTISKEDEIKIYKRCLITINHIQAKRLKKVKIQEDPAYKIPESIHEEACQKKLEVDSHYELERWSPTIPTRQKLITVIPENHPSHVKAQAYIESYDKIPKGPLMTPLCPKQYAKWATTYVSFDDLPEEFKRLSNPKKKTREEWVSEMEQIAIIVLTANPNMTNKQVRKEVAEQINSKRIEFGEDDIAEDTVRDYIDITEIKRKLNLISQHTSKTIQK